MKDEHVVLPSQQWRRLPETSYRGRIILLLSEVKLHACLVMALGVTHAVLGTLSLSLMHFMLVPTHLRVSFLTDLSLRLSPNFNSLRLLR